MYSVLFLLLLTCGISVGMFFSSSIVIKDTEDFINPKLSAGEITIITPENKTYSSPDSGYYPSTYGFESDEDGILPSYMTLSEYYPVSVYPSKNGHNKVLWFDDNGYSYRSGCYNNFTNNMDSGTIEFWFLVDDVSDRAGVIINQGPNSHLIHTSCRYDLWRYHDGVTEDLIIQRASGGNMPTPLDNTWYHIRIDFECTSGNYMGLAQYRWKCWIDGIESADMEFFNDEPYADNFRMGTSSAHTSYNMYIDAIGYSWDQNYNIGDNLNEGLLLSYENSTNLDWQGFSLDGQANNTIFGNTTITMPSDGIHQIQVFGNNTMGSIYESDLRHFTVGTSAYIAIITPENKTYTQPNSGYYPATYGFENDEDGSFPEGWVDNSGSSCTVEVQNSFDNHKKTLMFDDTSTTYNSIADLYFSNQTEGVIEFWFQKTIGSTWAIIQLRESTTSTLVLDTNIDGPDDGYFAINAGGEGWLYNNSYSDNTWYHIKFEFNCLTDKITYWVNGIAMFKDKNFTFSTDVINWLRFGSNSMYTGIFCLDALGFSNDVEYNEGDNLNEGLLLGYNSNIDFNWIGYSLDGQSNKTILGNTTITMPSDGTHSIQVFGNDSIGTMYESDLRYFATNSISPDITITSPISNQLYGTTPPDFSLSISGSDLDARWYSLDGGTTNIPFSGLSGTIDQTEWDKMGNGTVTITFYANDTANNIGQAGVTVRNDIIAPVITIISPTTAEEFDYTPIFDITIVEANLDEFWYMIDNGANNYTISSLTGTINQTAWDTASDGPITIRFYARDDAGNIGTNSVIVAKIPSELPTPTPSPGIPGYNLVAIIGITVIITAIIAYRKPTRK